MMGTRNRAGWSVVLATWMSVFAILVATLAWLPAAAQETPLDENGDEPPTMSLQETLDDEQGETGPPAAQMSVGGIDARCDPDAGHISGTVWVDNPDLESFIEIAVFSDDTKLHSIHVLAGASSIWYEVPLRDVDVAAERSVYVTVVGTGVVSDPAFVIHRAGDGSAGCGAAPIQRSLDLQDTEPEGEPELTEETPVTPTETETPVTPTETETPVTPTETETPITRSETETPVTPTETETPITRSETETPVTPTETETPVTPTETETPVTPTETPVPTVSYATVVNTGGVGLRCRTAPVDGGVITVVPEGTRVQVRGASNNGWTPVRCGGRDGWMAASYLRTESGSTTPPSTGTGTTATVINTGGLGLRCRTTPESGAIITLMAEGSTVAVRGATSNGWVPVTCAGQSGWGSATYLRLGTGSTGTPPTPTPTPAPGGGTGKYGVVVNTGSDSLRCRTAPVTGSTIVLLPPNTRVETRGNTVDGWVPVICSGQAGWVAKTYFALEGESGTTTPPPTSGGGQTVTVSGTGGAGLRCRTAPTSGSVLGVIPEGSRVQTRGSITSGWLPVSCFGSAGWVSAAYVLFDGGSGSGEFWIDINLSTQYMRVYRGSTVVMETYVSTGRPGFTTPTGTYYIIHKLPSQTMSGVLGGEYYYVPNVPWVMYFTNRGHAIHGAYWHNNFGRVMSHGCVNLPVSTAAWLYANTPYGTRVRIHY
jgi:uncharacterized protein YraI